MTDGFPAFVLGAGLGTRLRPLTDQVPKPLVPVFGKPLVTFAFDHLLAAGAGRFVVNTHHLPDGYTDPFSAQDGVGAYRGTRIDFRHEPVLLDTGGGIKNVEDLVGGNAFVCYNGDILTDLPLGPVLERHAEGGHVATLVLRSSGGPLHVQFDPASGCVRDFRGRLHGAADGGFLFTGITIFSPEIFRHIPAGQPVSIIDVYLDLLRRGTPVGGIVIDDGIWLDLGTIAAYREAHTVVSVRPPAYLPHGSLVAMDPSAEIGPAVRIEGDSAVGARARLGAGAVVRDSIVWEGAEILPGASVVRSVVRRGATVAGVLEDAVG